MVLGVVPMTSMVVATTMVMMVAVFLLLAALLLGWLGEVVNGRDGVG